MKQPLKPWIAALLVFTATGVFLVPETGASEADDFAPAAAVALSQENLFRSVDPLVLVRHLPVQTLLDGRRYFIGSPLDSLPVAFVSAVEVEPVSGWTRYGTETPGFVNLRLKRYHAGGEVGVFYGRSSGKYGREDFQAYLIGGAGNEKFNITVGAAFQDTEFRVPSGR